MNKTYNGEWPYTINLPNLKINNLQLKVGLYIPVRHQFHTVFKLESLVPLIFLRRVVDNFPN
jgi:vacuolar-type H+-ATPase catalytic subunit A/Vma1